MQLKKTLQSMGFIPHIFSSKKTGKSAVSKKKQLILATIVIELIALAGIFLFSWKYIEDYLEKEIQNNLLLIARYGSKHIHTVGLQSITHENAFFFLKIREQLRDIEELFGLREGLVYIVELKEGKPVFSVMTNRKPFRGHPYPPEIADRIQLVYQGKEIVSGLYKDRNGTFISVIVPLFHENEIVGAMEMDFPGHMYKKMLYTRLTPFLSGLFLLLALFSVIVFLILFKLYNVREREFKQFELQLIQKEKMALLDRLVSGIAHEVNTPLSVLQNTVNIQARSIKNITEIVNESVTIADIQQHPHYQKIISLVQANYQSAIDAGKRIHAVVKSLKHLAGIDASAFKKANINEGLDSVITLLHSDFGDRITMTRNYGDIPQIYCYPVQLNQVFMAMLVNAAEAIPDTGEIKISTSSDDNFIHVNISDTGNGIPPDKLDKLFDLQFTHKDSRMHMGMGLANACNIVQKHRGKITVDSKVGKGSEFIISLPKNLERQIKG